MTHRPQTQDSDTKEKETYSSASPYTATTLEGPPSSAQDLPVLVALLRGAHSEAPWWPVGYVGHNPWGCPPAPLRASRQAQRTPENTWSGVAVLGSATGAGGTLNPQPDADTALALCVLS